MLRTPGAGPAQHRDPLHRDTLLPQGRKPQQHKPAEKKVMAGTGQKESKKALGGSVIFAHENPPALDSALFLHAILA